MSGQNLPKADTYEISMLILKTLTVFEKMIKESHTIYQYHTVILYIGYYTTYLLNIT